MSRRQPGMRVGAILGGDNKVVKFLGYGVYEGDEIPDAAAAGFADMCRDAGVTNPKIRLDNGDVVWGCECWWGPEEMIRSKMTEYEVAGYRVDTVRIADARREARPLRL